MDTTNSLTYANEIIIKYRPQVDEACNAKMTILEGVIYGLKLDYENAYRFMDKGILEAEKAQNDSIVVYGLHQKLNLLLDENRVQESEEILKRTSQILKKKPYRTGMQSFYDKKARIALSNNDYKLAVSYYDTILTYRYYDDSIALATNHNNRGVAYLRLSDYERAAQELLKATEINSSVAGGQLADNYFLLGHTYKLWGQNDIAQSYLKKGLIFARKSGFREIEVKILTSLAASLQINNQLNEALTYVNESIDLQKSSPNVFEKAKAYLVQSRILSDLHGFNLEMKIALDQAYTYSKQTETLSQFAPTSEMINYYLYHKQLSKAKEYLDELQEISIKLDRVSYKSDFHEIASRYYAASGDYKESLLQHQKFYSLNTSVANAQVLSQVAAAERKFDSQQKEMDIEILNKEKIVQASKLETARTLRNLYLALGGIFAFSILALGIAFRKLKRNQTELNIAHKKLKELDQVKNKLFSIISHDLRSMIFPFRRASKVLKHHIQKGNQEKTLLLAGDLEKNANNISVVLDNLLEWSLNQMEGYSIQPELLNLNQEISSIFDVFEQQALEKNIQLKSEPNLSTDILFDKGAFHVIFRNLIANAIKFTENGAVTVDWKSENDQLVFNIHDTGIGMDSESIKNLFNSDETVSSLGTKGEKGTGLGLSLVNQFVEKLGGQIKVESKVDQGTVFELRFPYQRTNR